MSEDLGTEWKMAMLAGDFERAWRASDRIRASQTPDPHRFWQGEPFDGKRVMLRCLHGFGDSIQFLRYVPRLRQRASNVCIEVAPRFRELATRLDGVGDVITWGDDSSAAAAEWDVQMEVTELPYIFRTQVAELPLAVRYLHPGAYPDPPRNRAAQVGLVWTSGDWNPSRSIDFELLQPLFQVPGCEFWNLQPTAAPETAGSFLRENESCRQSVLRLAESIAGLDLVITVDTLAAHLAGAMGVRAWVLLQRAADWRWMQVREDSPWYPSLRLFRQPAEGDWVSVIRRVAAELRTLNEPDRRKA